MTNPSDTSSSLPEPPNSLPSLDLCEAIQTSNWSAAFSILSATDAHSQLRQVSKSSCGYSDWTPLHWACRNPHTPPELVRSILSLCPSLCLAQDSHGCTPLYYAVTHSVEEINILLVQTCPEAKFMKDRHGSIPFETLMRGTAKTAKSPKMLRAFILSGSEEKSISFLMSYARNPRNPNFSRTRWNMGIRLVVETIDWSCIPPSILERTTVDDTGETHKIRNIYDYFYMFVRISTLGTLKELPDKPFLPLHVTLSTAIPWAYFSLALAANPTEVWREDEYGNLPLHVAAVSRSVSDGQLYGCDRCCKKLGKTWYQKKDFFSIRFCPGCFETRNIEDSDEDSYEDLYDSSDDSVFDLKDDNLFSLIHHADKIPMAINQLITVNPKSASIPNKGGKICLNLAIESEMHYDKGIKAIFLAAPQALSTRELTTHLYPFMLAAALSKKKKEPPSKVGGMKFLKNDLNEEWLQKFTTCFSLLMENPTLVRGGL